MLAAMKFKDYTWPNNPRTFEVSSSRGVYSHKLPFSGFVIQDMGKDHRVFRGEGEFVGEDAYESFRRLAEVFAEGGAGILTHPVWQSVRACFVKLKLIEEPGENYLRYGFEFWECPEPERSTEAEMTGLEHMFHTVLSGESLGDIALGRGRTLEALLSLNPQLRNPSVLPAGIKIRVQ